MNIHLSSAEVFTAASIGLARQLKSVMRGRRVAHGLDDSYCGWQIHIEGACGECAVAKCLGIFWGPTVDTFKSGGDVGTLQVRTRSRHEYELIIRDDDRDEDTFILVTGSAPNYVVRGWILGADGKRAEFRKAHGGRCAAYFVPHQSLLPLDTLPPRNAGELYSRPTLLKGEYRT